MDLKPTGVIGLDDILKGRIPGERILLVGPPGTGKTILSLSLLYQALLLDQSEHGLFLTTEEQRDYLVNSVAGPKTGLFMKKLRRKPGLSELLNKHLWIDDFPTYPSIYPELGDPEDESEESSQGQHQIRQPGLPTQSGDREERSEHDFRLMRQMIMDLQKATRTNPDRPRPNHIVIDGLTAMQSVLSSRSAARHLTHFVINALSYPRRGTGDPPFGLCIVTAEASYGEASVSYGARTAGTFDDYLFDTIIHLDIIEKSNNRIRTLEVFKSRGRHARDGRHTYSIVGEDGLTKLLQCKAAQQEVRKYNVPIVIYPRPSYPRQSEEETGEDEYLSTGIPGLDNLLDAPDKRGKRENDLENVGLLKNSITAVVGGPATSFNTLALRYAIKGLEECPDKPVLIVSFGRDRANFLRRGQGFTWLQETRSSQGNKFDKNFHFLYYSPVGLNQNRLFYEIRKEIKPDKNKEPLIDRVVIHSVSNLPFAHGDPETSGEFLVPLINLLRELGCTAWITYVSDNSERILDAPGQFVPSLADNVIFLCNETTKDNSIITKISVLKGHGANILREERLFHMEDGQLQVLPLSVPPSVLQSSADQNC